MSGNVRVASGDFYSGTRKAVLLGVVFRLGANFSTNVFLNGLVQYNNVSDGWSANVRFNIIHRPLSKFFFVYNDLRDQNGAVIAKYRYLFSF